MIHVLNKIDLVPAQHRPPVISSGEQTQVYLSAKTGEGLAGLRDALKDLVGYDSGSEGVFIARRRHLEALEKVRQMIANGLNAIDAVPRPANCWRKT